MTTLVEWGERSLETRRSRRLLVLVEGIVLVVAGPVLLFPERLPLVAAAVLLLLALIWLVSLAVAPFPATPFNLLLLLWCVALLIGIGATADPAETMPKAMGLLLGLAVWRFLVAGVTTRRHLAAAVALWLLLSLAFTFIGAFSLQESPKIPALAAINPLRGLMLPGLDAMAVHPNQLAGLICLLLPVLVSLVFAPAARPAARMGRAVLGLVALLVVWVLLLTQSRGGWVGAVAGLYGLLVLWGLALPPSRARRNLRAVAVAVLAVALAAVLWIGPATLRDLWLSPPSETALGTLTTLNYRKELWPWAITAIGDFPFTGLGLGAFRQVAFRLYPLPLSAEQDIGHAHNIFLQTALDTGLPGLVIYVAILMVAVAVGWRIARRDAGFRAVALGLLAGLAALHIFGLADALALGSKPGVIFWFALGLLAAMNKEGLAA